MISVSSDRYDSRLPISLIQSLSSGMGPSRRDSNPQTARWVQSHPSQMQYTKARLFSGEACTYSSPHLQWQILLPLSTRRRRLFTSFFHTFPPLLPFFPAFLVESLLSGRFQIISPGFRRKKICPKQSPLFYCSVKNKSRGLTLHKEKNTSYTS